MFFNIFSTSCLNGSFQNIKQITFKNISYFNNEACNNLRTYYYFRNLLVTCLWVPNNLIISATEMIRERFQNSSNFPASNFHHLPTLHGCILSPAFVSPCGRHFTSLSEPARFLSRRPLERLKTITFVVQPAKKY